MDEGLNELLKANLEISKENHKILKGLQRAHRNAAIFRVIHWIFVIGLTFGAFYFVEPFIRKLMEMLPGLNQFSSFLPK